MVKCQGGCHCGAVRFEIETDDEVAVQACNCSICEKLGYLHLIVPASKFKLLSGEDALTTYTFNTRVAKHTFCNVCGIKSFYVPRSNPDGFSVNLRCLDNKPGMVHIAAFDGQNWEMHGDSLSHLSKDK